MTTDSLPMPDAQDSAPAPDEAVKPKRTRRPKAAEAADVTPATAVGVAEGAADVDPPKRAPRRRKVDADLGGAQPASEAVASETAADAAEPLEVPARKRAPRRKASPDGDLAAPEAVSQAADQGTDGALARREAESDVAQVGGQAMGVESEGPSGEQPPRQEGEWREGRGDRRGRRRYLCKRCREILVYSGETRVE
jgi:hypothetical protein